MPTANLCLVGFGNVGRALVRLLIAKREEILRRYQTGFRIVAIATARHGAAIDPQGIHPERALQLRDAGESISSLSAKPTPTTMAEFIEAAHADVLLENTPLDERTGQPSIDHLRAALEIGMHAITANKGPIVHCYRELADVARSRGRRFLFEATVMHGAPIFSLWQETLLGVHLESFSGILNSTTNYILCLMEDGKTFGEALSYAQSIGIAETNPDSDIHGWDAAVKVAALATVLMDVRVAPDQVRRQGIDGISTRQVNEATASGKRWKMICQARRTPDGVFASVEPQLVDMTDPLYGVSGTSLAITFNTDMIEGLTIAEQNPGLQTTAFGLLADLIRATRSQ